MSDLLLIIILPGIYLEGVDHTDFPPIKMCLSTEVCICLSSPSEEQAVMVNLC